MLIWEKQRNIKYIRLIENGVNISKSLQTKWPPKIKKLKMKRKDKFLILY